MKKNTQENIELLWNVIRRFDIYITSTNIKSGLLITFNTFIFSYIALNWDELFKDLDSIILKLIAILLLSIICISALISIWNTFLVINPFLKSKKSPVYHSKIFFQHIAEYETSKSYLASLEQMEIQDSLEDLSQQVYALSNGLKIKFKHMKMAINTIIIGEIIPLIIVVIYKSISSILK